MVYSRAPFWPTAQHESIAYPTRHFIPLELGKNAAMHISAKADYGMRALLELTSVYLSGSGALVKAETISAAQDIPVKFLEGILRQLRQTGIVASKRGAAGGYRLDRSPSEVTIADVVRALDGPLAAVRGQRPEDVEYAGPSEHLKEVWVAVRAAMRDVLEHITLADVAANNLPDPVTRLLDEPGAWQRRKP
jgi:Rrf2 family protein